MDLVAQILRGGHRESSHTGVGASSYQTLVPPTPGGRRIARVCQHTLLDGLLSSTRSIRA